MDKWQTLQAFWESFGLPAYDDQAAFADGDAPAYPHISYESFIGNLGQRASLSVHLWYRESSFKGIKQKAAEIEAYLEANRPVTIEMDGGYLWLSTPTGGQFAAPFPTGSDDSMVKRVRLSLEAEFLTAR